MDNNLDQKRQQLLDKYKSLFIQKTGFNGVNLDNYVNKLIGVGEQYYGSNFVEDILGEKRDDSILWLIDEISRYSWIDSRNLNTVDNSKSLPAGNPATENLENALNGNTPKGLPDGQLSKDNSEIYAAISNMNEYELEDYLKKVITNENSNKFYSVVSSLKKENPNLSDFEIYKKALLDSNNGIVLVNPDITVEEKQSVDNLLNTMNGNVSSVLPNSSDVLAQEEKEKGQMLANAFAAVANQKAETEMPKQEDNIVNENNAKEPDMLGDVFRTITGREPDSLPNYDDLNSQEGIESDEFNDLSNNETTQSFSPMETVSEIPATAKAGKRKEAPKGLINKFKEKWQDPKFKKKLLIGGIAIAVVGIGVIAATAISQIMSTQSLDTNMIINANHLTSSLIDGLNLDSISNNIDTSAVSGTEYMDYTVNTGDTIYNNAADAISGQNGVSANEWFTDQPQGIYDTANNTWVDTSNVDFNSVEDMKQFMDGNHAIVEGGNGDLDGFRPIDENMIKSK